MAAKYILTVFAYGCNLGPTEAARHMQGLASAHELSFTNRRHVSVTQLEAGIKDLVNAYLHIDQAQNGCVMSVYNMIGEKIYNKVLSGTGDFWNLVNNNGVHVVTGVYLVLIQSPAGKTSVQRIAILNQTPY